jgi:hypothetical protein
LSISELAEPTTVLEGTGWVRYQGRVEGDKILGSGEMAERSKALDWNSSNV